MNHLTKLEAFCIHLWNNTKNWVQLCQDFHVGSSSQGKKERALANPSANICLLLLLHLSPSSSSLSLYKPECADWPLKRPRRIQQSDPIFLQNFREKIKKPNKTLINVYCCHNVLMQIHPVHGRKMCAKKRIISFVLASSFIISVASYHISFAKHGFSVSTKQRKYNYAKGWFWFAKRSDNLDCLQINHNNRFPSSLATPGSHILGFDPTLSPESFLMSEDTAHPGHSLWSVSHSRCQTRARIGFGQSLSLSLFLTTPNKGLNGFGRFWISPSAVSNRIMGFWAPVALLPSCIVYRHIPTVFPEFDRP